ncbi:hypothetical protein KXW38_001979, partial [Aspergillus fumigatus]
HGFGNVGAEDAQMRCVLRQRDAGADADFEHAPADTVGRGNRGLAALAEHAAKNEIVDRSPAVIRLLDRRTVEIELLPAVELDDVCHDLALHSASAGDVADWPQRTRRLERRQITEELPGAVLPRARQREIPASLSRHGERAQASGAQ